MWILESFVGSSVYAKAPINAPSPTYEVEVKYYDLGSMRQETVYEVDASGRRWPVQERIYSVQAAGGDQLREARFIGKDGRLSELYGFTNLPASRKKEVDGIDATRPKRFIVKENRISDLHKQVQELKDELDTCVFSSKRPQEEAKRVYKEGEPAVRSLDAAPDSQSNPAGIADEDVFRK